MTATTVAPTAELDALVDDLFDGAVTITRRDLADRLGISLDAIRSSVDRGDLTLIRVSERRLVASRSAVRRYLIALQERER